MRFVEFTICLKKEKITKITRKMRLNKWLMKEKVEAITSMDEDFAKWYTDICKKAELVEYTSVKGCMVIRPYGYAIWENMQRILDAMFKGYRS